MGRGPSAERVAARYQVRLDNLHRSVEFEVHRGNLRAALRMVLGFAEDMAMEGAKAVEPLGYHHGHLSPSQHDRLAAAWRKAVGDAMGELGLFLTEKKG